MLELLSCNFRVCECPKIYELYGIHYPHTILQEGQAPLHLSVISGKREDLSRLLLEHKADPNIVDKVMR